MSKEFLNAGGRYAIVSVGSRRIERVITLETRKLDKDGKPETVSVEIAEGRVALPFNGTAIFTGRTVDQVDELKAAFDAATAKPAAKSKTDAKTDNA